MRLARKALFETNIPILGICARHQLICKPMHHGSEISSLLDLVYDNNAATGRKCLYSRLAIMLYSGDLLALPR